MGVPLRIDTDTYESLPVHPLNGQARATLVYKCRPKDSLPWLGRVLVDFLWKKFKWGQQVALDAEGKRIVGIEGISICKCYEDAHALAAKHGWSVHELPVDDCLPDEPVQYGRTDTPRSSSSPMYRARDWDMKGITKRDLDEMKTKIHEVNDNLSTEPLM